MIRKFKMTFDVNISLSTFGELENFPWIRPSDFLQAMAANGDFNKMLGGKSLKDCAPTLKEFWLRFQCLYPQHAVFQTNAATTDFSKYVPFYCHGDEGTGYKKKGVLIIAFQPVLGYGGRHSPNKQAGIFLPKRTCIYTCIFYLYKHVCVLKDL